MKIKGLCKYIEESGLAERIKNLKAGDAFGVELPVDEENNKWCRFWLSTEGSEDKITNVTLDFEGMLRIRVCTDEQKLEDWLENSGFMELVNMIDEDPAQTENEEVES